MLTLLGNATRRRRAPGLCDGVSRRDFLTIGGLGAGSLALAPFNLANVLRADAATGVNASNKSVIMIFLVGGASHIDMFDMKPDAPDNIRGPYQGIDTSAPGIRVCEHLPQLAQVMDRMVLIRSLEGGTEAHAAYVCLTGFPAANERVERPCFGSAVSKIQGSTIAGMPPFVALTPKMKHAPWCVAGLPGFLGPAYAPFQPFRDRSGDTSLLKDMTLSEISRERLGDRRNLLRRIDKLRRNIDHRGSIGGMDEFQRQAFEVLTSSRLVEALDLEREDPRVRERYGRGSMKNLGNGAPRCNHHFLLARRLVEAGVRCVSLAYGHWDWHSKQADYLQHDFPPFDQGLSALIEDLYARGLDRDVMVVVWGEMGRTPRINKNAGRDHWPLVSSALLTGGGMPTGQVLGATNRYGEYSVDRPIHYQNVLATCYHHLGIFPGTKNIVGDFLGLEETLPLLEKAHPIHELLS